MTRYCGIDASSKSLAFGVIENDELVSYGEIFFTKPDFDLRLVEARHKLESLMLTLFHDVDYIGFEQAVMVNNRQVVIKLAEMFGVIKSVLLDHPTARLVQVPPMVWQGAIGNPVLKGKDRKALVLLHPEWRTIAQTRAGIRKHRKDVTKHIVKQNFGLDIDSDNVCDSIGIALFIKEKM